MRHTNPDFRLLEGIQKFIRDTNFNVALTLQRHMLFGEPNVLEQDYKWDDAARFAHEMNFALRGPLWRKLPQRKTIQGVVTIEKINTSPHFHFALCIPVDLLGKFANLVEDVWLSIRPSGDIKMERSSRSKRAGWAEYMTKEGKYSSLEHKWLHYSELLDRTSRDPNIDRLKRRPAQITGFYTRMSARYVR